MTRAKELLDAATPLPWTVRDDLFEYAIVKGAGGQSVTSLIAPADARLIRDAVNTLPAYEAAVEALRGLVATFDEYDADGVGYGGFPVSAAREALRRLQEQTQ